MDEDILDKLNKLIKQATKERSHYYVKKCAEEAAHEIKHLREKLSAIHVASRTTQ